MAPRSHRNFGLSIVQTQLILHRILQRVDTVLKAYFSLTEIWE